MRLVSITGKFWTIYGKLVSAFWWILRYDYWDDEGVWIDKRAEEFFNNDNNIDLS
jgi:hypothetical protein